MKPSRAFTLIELLVVIAIIGLLAAIVMVSLNSARAKARDSRRMADLKQLQVALELYYDVNGQYPPMFSGVGATYCSALVSAPAGWISPYLNALPADPVGTGSLPYVYEYCQQNSGSYNRQTYILWTTLEKSSGNMGLGSWPVGAYRPTDYNYVIFNWRP